MTKRKLDMLRVAKALGLPEVPGETTSALADRCEACAAELLDLARADGGDDLEDESAEGDAEEAPRANARPKGGRGEARGREGRRARRQDSRASRDEVRA